ncbi:MAG: hypothetical protein ACUZ8I_14270 [Candidatus Scalindua sp.]
MEDLETHVGKLKQLLDNPHPGIATWCEAYGAEMKAISDFWTHDKVETELKSNKSYRNNLIERLDKFYKSLLKDTENHRILSEEVVSDSQFHDGQSVMAYKAGVRFKLEFLEELKK